MMWMGRTGRGNKPVKCEIPKIVEFRVEGRDIESLVEIAKRIKENDYSCSGIDMRNGLGFSCSDCPIIGVGCGTSSKDIEYKDARAKRVYLIDLFIKRYDTTWIGKVLGFSQEQIDSILEGVKESQNKAKQLKITESMKCEQKFEIKYELKGKKINMPEFKLNHEYSLEVQKNNADLIVRNDYKCIGVNCQQCPITEYNDSKNGISCGGTSLEERKVRRKELLEAFYKEYNKEKNTTTDDWMNDWMEYLKSTVIKEQEQAMSYCMKPFNDAIYRENVHLKDENRELKLKIEKLEKKMEDLNKDWLEENYQKQALEKKAEELTAQLYKVKKENEELKGCIIREACKPDFIEGGQGIKYPNSIVLTFNDERKPSYEFLKNENRCLIEQLAKKTLDYKELLTEYVQSEAKWIKKTNKLSEELARKNKDRDDLKQVISIIQNM